VARELAFGCHITVAFPMAYIVVQENISENTRIQCDSYSFGSLKSEEHCKKSITMESGKQDFNTASSSRSPDSDNK
jgi:hypothetical protein